MEAGEAGLASKSHRWPTQSKLANMSRAMSPYTSYWSIRVTMKLEIHTLGRSGAMCVRTASGSIYEFDWAPTMRKCAASQLQYERFLVRGSH